MLKPKCNCRKKSMQEKESVIVQFELKSPSLGITLASLWRLVMPNSYPRDGIFNPNLTTIKDSYSPRSVCLITCTFYPSVNPGIWASSWHLSRLICPVWSESSLSAWRKLGSLATHWAQAKTLIRLGGCPGRSESLLRAQSFWLVLSWGGSLEFNTGKPSVYIWATNKITCAPN